MVGRIRSLNSLSLLEAQLSSDTRGVSSRCRGSRSDPGEREWLGSLFTTDDRPDCNVFHVSELQVNSPGRSP